MTRKDNLQKLVILPQLLLTEVLIKDSKFFNPVPYSINFQLNAYAKSQDDALQIVEQILPTFNPQYALTIKPFATEFPSFKEDIQVIIQSVAFSDDFEGAMEQRRTIIYSLDFEMKLSYHGPINNSAIIRDARAKIFDIKAGLNDSDIGLETIIVRPNPTDVIGLDDSTFGFQQQYWIVQIMFEYKCKISKSNRWRYG